MIKVAAEMARMTDLPTLVVVRSHVLPDVKKLLEEGKCHGITEDTVQLFFIHMW